MFYSTRSGETLEARLLRAHLWNKIPQLAVLNIHYIHGLILVRLWAMQMDMETDTTYVYIQIYQQPHVF